MMKFTSLANGKLQPSVLCLGTGAFGSDISTDDSFAMLDTFAEAGGNFVDAAHIYASWLPDGAGKSERTLGKWLASRKPQGFLVGTKGGHPDLSTMEISRLAPEDIAGDLEESLERLGVDVIDLYWLHRDDPNVPINEIMDALNEHIIAGRVRAAGASNWSTARIEEANAYADKRGLTGFCASQIGWSLAEINPAARGAGQTLQMDDETLDWHRRSGFPCAAYSAQANEFFSYPLPEPNAVWTEKQKSLASSYLSPKNVERYYRAGQLTQWLGRATHEIALAYLWSHSFPVVAIIGASRLDQLRASLCAADLMLSQGNVAFLEGSE